MAAEQGSWLLEPFTDPMFVYFPLETGAAALASLLAFMLPLTLLSFKDPAYLSKYKVLKPMLVWFTSIFHSFFLFLCFLSGAAQFVCQAAQRAAEQHLAFCDVRIVQLLDLLSIRDCPVAIPARDGKN